MESPIKVFVNGEKKTEGVHTAPKGEDLTFWQFIKIVILPRR